MNLGKAKPSTNIEESGNSDLTAFTYDFKDDLKLSASRRRTHKPDESPDLERNIDEIDLNADVDPNSPDI